MQDQPRIFHTALTDEPGDIHIASHQFSGPSAGDFTNQYGLYFAVDVPLEARFLLPGMMA